MLKEFCIVFGIVIVYWTTYGTRHMAGECAWRLPSRKLYPRIPKLLTPIPEPRELIIYYSILIILELCAARL